MNEPELRINKLPKWAQEYIGAIERERDSAKDAVARMSDTQTPSPIFVQEWVSCSNRVKHFIQGDRVIVEHAGVHLEVFLARKNDSQRMYGVELSYSDAGGIHGLGACGVAVYPRSSNTIQLVHQKNLGK